MTYEQRKQEREDFNNEFSNDFTGYDETALEAWMSRAESAYAAQTRLRAESAAFDLLIAFAQEFLDGFTDDHGVTPSTDPYVVELNRKFREIVDSV